MSLRGLALSTPDNPYNACMYGVITHPLYHRCEVCQNVAWCEFGKWSEALAWSETNDERHLHCKLGLGEPDHNAVCQYCAVRDECFRFMVKEPLDLDETKKLLQKLKIVD